MIDMTTNSLIEFGRRKGKNPPFNLSEVMPKVGNDDNGDAYPNSLRLAMDL
jgi:hypothetical protein